MDPPGLKRRLTCILATDAVGYSRLVNEDETGALRVLAAHRAVIDGIIAYHEGRIANTAGDSVLAEFGSVVEGVRCAVEIQDALKTRNESLPEAQQMHFRIGINLGEVVVKGDDLLGDGVNVAARLQSVAEPGGILVSSSVYDQITGKLDLGFQDMGDQALKNISRPIRAFRVSGGGGTAHPTSAAPRPAFATTPGRAWPIAIGVVAFAALAGGVAWMQGWVGGSRSAEVRVAAPDSAKAKLEADLAASEKARADAEQRARTADADAVKARAEGEAAALRARAESDAAALRAKAQADAAAMRSQATQAQEASRAKAADADAALRARAQAEAAALKAKSEADAEAMSAKAKADVVAIQAKAAQEAAAAKAAEEASAPKAAAASAAPRAADSDASRYDGAWVATYRCSAVGKAPPFTRSSGLVVRGGEFTVERGVPGQPGYDNASGRVAADGTLVMTGNGVSPLAAAYGRRYDIRFEGRWTGDRFVLNGPYGGRTCDVEIARPGAASEPRDKARRS